MDGLLRVVFFKTEHENVSLSMSHFQRVAHYTYGYGYNISLAELYSGLRVIDKS